MTVLRLTGALAGGESYVCELFGDAAVELLGFGQIGLSLRLLAQAQLREATAVK